MADTRSIDITLYVTKLLHYATMHTEVTQKWSYLIYYDDPFMEFDVLKLLISYFAIPKAIFRLKGWKVFPGKLTKVVFFGYSYQPKKGG